MPDDALTASLRDALVRTFPDSSSVTAMRRLSGGASQETWSFDLGRGGGALPLILRRGIGGGPSSLMSRAGIGLDLEAELIRAAGEIGVPVPAVRYVLRPEDGLGAGFVMDRIDGETIPRKILRDEAFAGARPRLARQCGEIAARIHSLPPSRLPPSLPQATALEQLEQYRALYESFDDPLPVFELASRWLREHVPPECEPVLVHGDFRNGNLIVGPDGVRAVLDWELAHRGDPMEDLGWICVNSWRFGEIDNPVGGFGKREELFAGYGSVSGRQVDAQRVHYWEVLGTWKWGIMCKVMYGIFRGGLDRSIERAAIGRRVSETEIDLLDLLVAGRGG